MTRARDLSNLGDNTSKLEQASLIQVIASSVVKGASGSGSVDSKGNVTFSGTESISLNDVFSSVYTNYFIIFEGNGSTGTGLRLRFRTTTDETGSNYARYNQYVSAGAGPSRTVSTSQNTLDLCYLTTGICSMNLWVFNPNTAKINQVQGLANSWTSTADLEGAYFSGVLNNTNSYTGFTLYPTTGTFTCTIREYGYNQ